MSKYTLHFESGKKGFNNLEVATQAAKCLSSAWKITRGSYVIRRWEPFNGTICQACCAGLCDRCLNRENEKGEDMECDCGCAPRYFCSSCGARVWEDGIGGPNCGMPCA